MLGEPWCMSAILQIEDPFADMNVEQPSSAR